MWFQIIEGLNGRQILGGFNQSQIRELLQGFKYEIMNEVGGDRECILRREMSILGFLLVGTRFINGSVR